ncbi:MAG: RimK family protein [Melioribacteraceae bacterium]|nr:RimK family protein [Melioribacteraceae bacterium]MCF8263537.1 RimK family protein [Melioribacteraceae bacterium]MCF8413517.1 RimK family protein [Melioribacteraceae bacterium]MCF8430663.1 RimK family protein [Melioribacteraceae bacterium]
MKTLVVVNNPKDWNFNIDGVELIAAKSYLMNHNLTDSKSYRIFNLCRSYRYQSTGYYVSLLAEARGHRVFPNVSTIQDLKSQTIVKIISEDIDQLIQKELKKIKSEKFVLSIYFGKNLSSQYDSLAQQLGSLFQAPLIRAVFVFNKKWMVQNISPIPVNEIPKPHLPYVEKFAVEYFSKQRIHSAKVSRTRYDLAILVNPDEKEAPSDPKAIKQFIKAAEENNIRAELITKNDFNRIPEFDALFIRETTSVNHHTYRFARRAFAEGLFVIDDPRSIVKCSNKVYLAEILAKAKVPTVNTVVASRENKAQIETQLKFPIVLKQPDSSFSQGVIKVENKTELNDELERLFDISDLVIAQEFKYSDFDWRIGIINRQPIYACKYFMAKNHWQIYNWKANGDDNTGNYETLDLKDVPEKIIKTALKATNLIGDGLYGVDIKQSGKEIFVIEINDNPSIEYGVEDKIGKMDIYMSIMKVFYDRLETMRLRKEINL